MNNYYRLNNFEEKWWAAHTQERRSRLRPRANKAAPGYSGSNDWTETQGGTSRLHLIFCNSCMPAPTPEQILRILLLYQDNSGRKLSDPLTESEKVYRIEETSTRCGVIQVQVESNAVSPLHSDAPIKTPGTSSAPESPPIESNIDLFSILHFLQSDISCLKIHLAWMKLGRRLSYGFCLTHMNVFSSYWKHPISTFSHPYSFLHKRRRHWIPSILTSTE